MFEKWRKDKKQDGDKVWADYLAWALVPTSLTQCQDLQPLLAPKAVSGALSAGDERREGRASDVGTIGWRIG